MTQKWNLQDIRPAEPRPRRSPQFVPSEEPRRPNKQNVSEEYEEEGKVVIKNGDRERKLNLLVIAGIVVFIVAGIFVASLLVSKTTLTVYPEFSEPTVNADFIAYPDLREGQLTYEVMTLTETGERQVQATGKETVTEQAKGFIEIIKSTPGAERLIKNTRFRSPDGLIFRIQESVVVPGAISDGAGKLVPGSIRAEVFADSPGQEYNLVAGTRFDIPGFQESNLPALYSAIYAENRETFSGGFNGPRFIIDDAVLAEAEQSLQVELRNKLIARVDGERPADFVAFPGAITVTYISLPTLQFGDNLVTLKQEAVLQQPLFREADFASYIAKETIPTYQRESVRITNLSELTFTYTDASISSQNIANATSLNFKIHGKPQVVWNFDAEKLRVDLAGKALTAISVALSGHTSIKSAEITEKPFWKRNFPEDKDDINIIEIIGNPNKPK